GVLATGNSLRVALLTPTSVDCADRVTATRSSYGDEYSSSVTGRGLSSRNRVNNSVISARVRRDRGARLRGFFMPGVCRGLPFGAIRRLGRGYCALRALCFGLGAGEGGGCRGWKAAGGRRRSARLAHGDARAQAAVR